MAGPKTGPGAPEPFYRPELDGLRFLAFLSVFCRHSLPDDPARWERLGFGTDSAEWLVALVHAGGYGVDLFFALSAYLLTELLLREVAFAGAIDVRRFLVRRALRIWPLYFAFLAIVGTYLAPPGTLALFAVFAGNWACALGGYPNAILAPLWSVSVEEQFYLVWPWIIGLGSRLKIGLACVGAVILALGARALIVTLDATHPAIWCNSIARLDSFAAGALVAVVLKGRTPQLGTGLRFALLALAAAILIGVGRFVKTAQISWLQLPSYLGVAVACGAIVMASLRSRLRRSRGPLASPRLVYLGKISYGLYVFHMLGLRLGAEMARAVGVESLPVRIALGFAITLGLAALSFRVLELPALRLKERFAVVRSRPAV